jgi:hypothetical protein
MDFPANLTHWTPLFDGASGIAVAYGVAKAFDYFEGLISDRNRVALWYNLANVPDDERIESWGNVFPQLIDRVYGPKALSWQFFLRSCLVSLIASFSFAALYLLNSYSEAIDSFFLGTLLASEFAVFGIAFSFIPDYVSVVISRAIVRLMVRNTTA